MKKLVIALGLTFGLNTGIYANSALHEYRQGNYEQAKKGLEKLVIKRNKDAFFYYGLMTLHGYSVKKDEAKAIELIKQSASRGYLDAQLFLATYYLDVRKNSKNAFYWFEKAANKGCLAAQLYVASAYHHGFGTKKNANKENKYIIRAAKQGSKVAQFYLAKKFLKKRSYRSHKLGISWLKKSAKKGYIPAYYELIMGYQNDYDKKQYWLDKLKSTKSEEAEYYLGKYYLSFNNRDIKLSAIKWFNLAAQKNHVPAIYELGILHQSSELNILDDKRAFSEMLQAAQQGYKPAEKQLSHMYKEGIGTTVNHEKSKYYLNKSKSQKFLAQKQQTINWVTNNLLYSKTPSVYQHNSILTKWQDEHNIKTGTMNQSPKMQSLSQKQLFNTKLKFTNPQEIDAHLLADTIRIGKNTVFNKLPAYPIPNKSPSKQEVKDTYSRALLGNREAQFLLGKYHELGIGVDTNLNAAAQWYFSSAKQNYLPAEYSLGIAFLKGQGIKQNLQKASYWLNRTAFKGNVDAQYALGVLYQHGFRADDNLDFISPDKEQSTSMYHLASGGGNPKAKYQIAQVESQKNLNALASNFDKEKQHKKVSNLFEQAYQGGVTEAKLPLAFYYVKESIATEKQKWAYEVLSNEAKNGNSKVSLLLALMNERGIGTRIDYNEAIKWYKVAVKNNSSAAQFSLGSYYQLGQFVHKNTLKAQRLLNQAAQNNLYYADYNLGVIASEKMQDPTIYIQQSANAGYIKAKLFLADKLLEKNENLALVANIYKTLANKGNEQAELKLGYMHQHGIYFDKNPKKAKHYYLKAAAKNNSMAQYQLGYFHQLGLTGQAKANSAIHWYSKSANNNFVPAMVSLGYVYENNKNNYDKAKYWYAKASQHKNPIANYNLALIHDYGKGVEVDNSKAVRLYVDAANKGISSAKLNLAHHYYTNKGSNDALENSIRWYKEAAKDNSSQAHFKLARIHEVGLGTDVNPEKAKEHYQQALELGHIDAASSLARLHQSKMISSADPELAYKHYLKAASKTDNYSKYQLANLLYFGIGTEKSEKKAITLLSSLSKKGYEPAKVMLGNINFINKSKSTHRSEVAKLKKKAKKEGTELTELPKLKIEINRSIEEISKEIKTMEQYQSAEEMYLAAIEELEKGKLYKSYAILKAEVNKYPNYIPAKKALEFIKKQEGNLLL